MNLTMNSIEATKDLEGTREIAIKSQRAENGQVLVSVRDTGMGLPPQHQADLIFQVFITTKSDGTGMGFSISRSIGEAHGGRLWVANDSPPCAIFQFALPPEGERMP